MLDREAANIETKHRYDPELSGYDNDSIRKVSLPPRWNSIAARMGRLYMLIFVVNKITTRPLVLTFSFASSLGPSKNSSTCIFAELLKIVNVSRLQSIVHSEMLENVFDTFHHCSM